MTTYAQLKSRVETRVIDLPTAVTSEVPTLVLEAIRELQDRHDFKCAEGLLGPYSTDSTTPSHTLHSVPSDFQKPRGEPFYVRFDGSTARLTFTTQEEAKLQFATADTTFIGPPKVLVDAYPSDDDNTRNFEVYPYADGNSDWSDGEYRVYVPYWRYLTALSADGDSNWLTDNAARWIVAKATSEAFYLDWDENRGNLWAAKAEAEVNRVIRADKMYRLGAVEEFAYHRNVHSQRTRL